MTPAQKIVRLVGSMAQPFSGRLPLPVAVAASSAKAMGRWGVAPGIAIAGTVGPARSSL